jgi:hypothetical protein
MMDGKLSRAQIRRRILDNLAWGNVPHLVIEPLPPAVLLPPPPSTPVEIPEKPPAPRSASPAKRLARRLITSIPFLGRVALVVVVALMQPLIWKGVLRLEDLNR